LARRPIAWIGRSLAAVLGLLLLILVSLLIFQPTIKLQRLRPGIETALSRQIGTPVSIADIRLRVSLWPQLYLQDLRVATIDDQGAQDLGRVDNFEARISLLPLVRKRIFVVAARIDGCEVEIRPLLTLLERNRQPSNTSSDWAWVGIRQLEAVDLEVHHHTSRGEEHEIDITSLSGGVSQIEPLRMEIFGRIDGAPLEIDFSGPPIGNLLRLPEVLPVTAAVKLGELESNAQITVSKGRVLIDELTGRFEGSPVSGTVDITLTGDKPRISGHLRLERLGVGRWLAFDDGSSEGKSAFTWPAELRQALSAIELPLDGLDAVDTALDLEIASIEDLPVEMRDIVARITLDQGSFEASAQLSLAGARAESKVQLEPSDSGTRWFLDFGLSGLSLDRLRDLDPALAPLEGEVADLHLTVTSQGSNLGDLLEESSADFEIKDSSLTITDPGYQRDLDFEIATMDLRHRPSEKLLLDLRGSLRGQSFHLAATSDRLLDLKQNRPWPIDLNLQSLGFESELAAIITTGPGSTEIAMQFQFDGDSLADLSNWLGVPNEITLPFSAAGTTLIQPTELSVVISAAHLGQSSFSGEMRSTLQAKRHLRLELAFSEFDTIQLKSLLRSAQEGEISDEAFNLDLPVLPGPILLPDTDLKLSAARIARQPADLKDVVVDLEFADGRLRPSPFFFTVGDSKIDGRVELSWDREVPRIQIDMSGNDVQVSDFFDAQLDGEKFDASVDALHLAFTSEGRTLRKLLSLESDIELSARGVEATVPLEPIDPIDISFDELRAEAHPGKPLHAEASGRVNELNAEISLKAHPGSTYEIGDDLPVTMIGSFDQIRAELRGDIGFPLAIDNQELWLDVTAPTLDSFVPTVDVDLPEVGPVHFVGSLAPNSSGFEIEIEELAIASSELVGSLMLDTTGQRPRAEVELRAKRIAPHELWIQKAAEAKDEPPAETHPVAPVDLSDALDWMHKFDATLSLQIDEIEWGEVRGGGGSIQATLGDSHLNVSRFELDQIRSHVDLRTDLHLHDEELQVDFGLRLESFLYGPIARALNSEAEEEGTLDLDTELELRGNTLDELLASGTGHFNFALYPNAVNTKVLDLWAVSLGSVLRILNPRNESTLNCLVGSFSIDQGNMQAESLLLDTSSLRAAGRGNIDLSDGTVAMKLTPRPKRRTFLYLATPIRVSGTVDRPDIHVTAGGVAGTAFRIYAWLFTVYRELFRQPLPRDGSDICVSPPPRSVAPDVIE